MFEPGNAEYSAILFERKREEEVIFLLLFIHYFCIFLLHLFLLTFHVDLYVLLLKLMSQVKHTYFLEKIRFLCRRYLSRYRSAE